MYSLSSLQSSLGDSLSLLPGAGKLWLTPEYLNSVESFRSPAVVCERTTRPSALGFNGSREEVWKAVVTRNKKVRW